MKIQGGGPAADDHGCGYFTAFFQKYIFLGIVWFKFLLKTALLNG